LFGALRACQSRQKEAKSMAVKNMYHPVSKRRHTPPFEKAATASHKQALAGFEDLSMPELQHKGQTFINTRVAPI